MLEEATWLYRGVPVESSEVADVNACGEIRPPRPERIGEYWQHVQMCGDTETGYTSWSADRDIAEAAAQDASDNFNLSGRIVIFRVCVDSLSEERMFPGREDEDEILIEGTVEDVAISKSAADEEEP